MYILLVKFSFQDGDGTMRSFAEVVDVYDSPIRAGRKEDELRNHLLSISMRYQNEYNMHNFQTDVVRMPGLTSDSATLQEVETRDVVAQFRNRFERYIS